VRALQQATVSQRRRVHEHAFLTLAFVASRVALSLAGLRLNFDLAWMFLADPRDLRERLAETLLYFHAYPPGMNLATGVVLKLGGAHAALLGELLYGALGLVLVNSLFYMLRAVAIRRIPAFVVTALFAIVPPTLYLEHLWLWEQWVAALLALGGVLFHRALAVSSFARWLGFFAVCAAIGVMRASFQLTWLLSLLALACWLVEPALRRRVLLAALGPLVLLASLHVKNWVLFDVFGAQTAGGGNLALVTVLRMPEAERNAWVKDGRLSRFAAYSVYAPPSEYLRYFPPDEARRFPDVDTLQALERPSVKHHNFNHWVLLEVNRVRAADAVTYVRERPGAYARTVATGLGQLFHPTTEWHPFDKSDRSPHHAHRQLLGSWERFYNGVVHGLPFEGVGLYVFLPILLFFSARWLVTRFKTPEPRQRLGLVAYALFQLAYVVPTSVLFTFQETSRYRYQIEAEIWLLAVFGLACAQRESRAHRAA
jgi:hypothetical protein